MADNPLINGLVYDHSSIEININGARYLQVSEISYEHELAPGELRGAAAKVLARSRGEYKGSGSFKMSKAESAQLVAALGHGYMTKSFTITLNYADDGMPYITDTLEGARLTKSAHSSSGSDPTQDTWDLHVMNILLNGWDATGEPGNLGTGIPL